MRKSLIMGTTTDVVKRKNTVVFHKPEVITNSKPVSMIETGNHPWVLEQDMKLTGASNG